MIEFVIEEQQSLSKTKEQFSDKWLSKDESWIHNLEFSKQNPKIHEIVNLGLSYFNNELCASYYIGIDWIKTKDEQQDYTKSLVVHPKIKNLDYVRMFVHCLKHPEIAKFLKDSYHLDFKRPLIKLETANWKLTPFMIVHFLSLVDKITKQGLKKNYIVVEENLNSKIKGKIKFSQQLKKNK
jgi:5-methylcytosine-specific restriction endonuclease McrBC regulatory subunit McrC